MSNNIVRIVVKKNLVNFDHYNLLEYEDSIDEICLGCKFI